MLKESITTDAQLNDFQEANMADLNANCTVNLRPVKSPHFRYQDGFTGDFFVELVYDADIYFPPDSSDMTEAEIAACVTQWLNLFNWNVYPEVVLKGRARRPDIVSVKGPWVQVVETKKALGLPLLEQVTSWQTHRQPDRCGIPHLIYAAVKRTGGRRSDFAVSLLKQYGIGLIEVSKITGGHFNSKPTASSNYRLRIEHEPTLQPGSRRLGHIIREQLREDMKVATAGTTGNGDYMTDWKRTMLRVEALMQDGKQRTTSEIVSFLDATGGHHWCSRASALSGVNASLTRLRYVQTPYAHGMQHAWSWDSVLCKSVLKGALKENLELKSL